MYGQIKARRADVLRLCADCIVKAAQIFANVTRLRLCLLLISITASSTFNGRLRTLAQHYLLCSRSLVLLN